MDEYQNEPANKPVLRPLRLIPARPGILPAEGLPVAAIGQEVESWLEKTSEMPTPALAAGGQALAAQAWLFIEKAALTLDGLPLVFRASEAPDTAQQALELIGSILLAFPDLMASGLETNVARVDWMFSRLINAPGRPGLVELIIEALEMLPTGDVDDIPLVDYSTEIEILRGLHRDLVTLQQRWDELIESAFPVVFPPPASPAPESESKTEPVGVSVGARASQPSLKETAPLPTGWMIAPVAGRGPSARAFRFHNVSKRQQRLAMVLVLVVLIVTVLGILLVEASRTPSITPGSDVLSVARHTPTSSATRQTPPTQTLPSPTPTKPAPTPTPRPPTPTPIPPTPTVICPNGSAFCVSTVQLQVPCAGEGSVTFQLMSNTRHSENWQAVSMFGGSLVTISPAFGTLKENQAVTISVRSNTDHAHEGTIMIVGPFGTSPVSVTAQVCSV